MRSQHSSRIGVGVTITTSCFLLVLGLACSGIDSGGRSPVAASSVSAPPNPFQTVSAPAGPVQTARMIAGLKPSFLSGDVLGGGREGWGATDVTFPPRNEPLLFRTALEAQYRDVLRRPAVSTFVDAEGTVVWTQEYLRYRVNQCSHAEAVFRVFRQLDGFGIQPVCGTTTTVVFPPRQEPFDFMLQLEAKYRDGLRRSSILSFVDVEGNIVWTQEYLRYRVLDCSHAEAQQRVFDQIAGRSVPPSCAPAFNFTFTVITNACACIVGSIEIRINNAVVANMGCAESRSFPATTSPYTASACGSNGCFGGNILGTFTRSETFRLGCS